jgi:hypothetical protein
VSGASGGGDGENARVVDLSNEEPNMNGARNCVSRNYWRALEGSVQQLEFHMHYSKYRWEILSSPRTVCLLTLMSGPVSWATMVSEPASPLLGVGSGAQAGSGYHFILAADADVWASHYFLSNEMCFPKILELIKQHLKNHKNTNNSYMDI